MQHLVLVCCLLTKDACATFFFFLVQPPQRSTLFPYTTLFRSAVRRLLQYGGVIKRVTIAPELPGALEAIETDRKSTRLNSSHQIISYAVFCLKKKNTDALFQGLTLRVQNFAIITHAHALQRFA